MEFYFTVRQKKILQLLQAGGGWVRGSELALNLGVTSRTVRSDIREMTAMLAEQAMVIESSKNQGYRLIGADKEVRFSGVQTPVLPVERQNFILKELICAKSIQDIYTLADVLLVSESTLENDLKRVRAYLQKHAPDVSLTRKGEVVSLSGSERAQRSLFSTLMLSETDGAFFSLANYENYFPHVRKIQKILLDCFQKHSYELNEFAVINLVVHIAITMERIEKLHFLSHASSMAEYTDTVEYRLAEDLCLRLQEELEVIFPLQERLYLMYLIMTKRRTDKNCSDRTELSAVVDQATLDAVNFMVAAVKRDFGLDLSDDEAFLVGFTLHIQALSERIKHRGIIRNPLLPELKRRYPIIFEIAVFMADCLKQLHGQMISEDEIGFITLHLGAALERYNEKHVQIKRVALVCPSGSTSTEILLTKLRNIYQNKMEIIGAFSFFAVDKIEQSKPDFIFATVQFEHDLQIPTIVISPFLDMQDIALINKTLNLWEHTAKKQKLEVDMSQYFFEEFFYDNPVVDEPFALLEFMSDVLLSHGFVPPEYKDSVLERERISSTAFNHLIAIPHAVVMNAHKTSVSVARFDKAIPWGEHRVQLVLLFAIRQGERKKLSDLYQYILHIIDKQEGVQYLAQAKTCAQFKERILAWE